MGERPTDPEPGDAALAEPLAALLEWVPEESGRLRRILLRAAGGAASRGAEIEDLLQDVWLRAFGKLDGLKARDRPGVRSWLARIARNCCHDVLRRGGATAGGGLEAESSALARDGRQGRHDRHESRGGVLRRLAPEERLILWMRGTQDLPWDVVRLVLRKPTVRVARSLYSQARHRVPVLVSLH